MKTMIKAVLATLFVAGLLVQPVIAQDDDKASPVEAFYCNLQDGKTMKDLAAVTERFVKWADKNDSGYTAWILTPQFANFMETPHLIWLGSWDSGNDMGKGTDAWMAGGGDIQAEFNKVLQCGGHALASSVPIHAPDGSPENGVVMFTQCSFAEGSDWSKAMAAHTQYSKAMRGLGAKNNNWLFFPMLGAAADRDFDYWGVSTFANYTDYFAAYEIYVNGGGWQKGMEAMQGKAECKIGSATVWDFKLVRSGAGS